MSNPDTNAAGVSTTYTRPPGPEKEGPVPDDPPPYSSCVPYPPAVNSNYSETRSSLSVNSSEGYLLNGIPNQGFQTGNDPHDNRSNAPFLDVTSTSENQHDLHNPRLIPYNIPPPAYNASYMESQINPPAYRHGPQTIILQRNGSRRCRIPIRMCTGIVIGIAIPLIIIARPTSRFEKSLSRIDHHNYDNTDYNCDTPVVNVETKINPIYSNPYENDFDPFSEESYNDTINDINMNRHFQDMQDNINKFLSHLIELRNIDTSRDTDSSRTLNDQYNDFFDIIRKLKSNADSRETKVDPPITDIIKERLNIFREEINYGNDTDEDFLSTSEIKDE